MTKQLDLRTRADDCSECGKAVSSRIFDSPHGLFSLCGLCQAKGAGMSPYWQVWIIEDENGRVVDTQMAHDELL